MIDSSHNLTGTRAPAPLSDLAAQVSAALRFPPATADTQMMRPPEIPARSLHLKRREGSPGGWGRERAGGLAGWQVRRVQAFIESNLDKSIGVADLACSARLSPSHFARAFHVGLGETPYSYLQRLRIERSLILLQTTVLPLCRIASECGFSDQSHFNRVFKKRTGGSPGAWRRAHADALVITQSANIAEAIAFFASDAARQITVGVGGDSKF
jgi:AraC-like DNA-binding protein